jgi:hypothetical protein
MSKHPEDSYLYHFVVTFDMKKKLFYIDDDMLPALEGPIWDEKTGEWLSIPEDQEDFYSTLNTVLHNGLQESNQFVIDAIEEALKDQGDQNE